jgi:hypothetical protein
VTGRRKHHNNFILSRAALRSYFSNLFVITVSGTMRFSTALAILVQAQPIVSDANVDQRHGTTARNVQSSNSILSATAHTNHLDHIYRTTSKVPLSRIRMKFARSGSLKNKERSNECDPKYADIDADTGILSCGKDELCMQDASSSIGGFCMKNSSTRTDAGTTSTETTRHLAGGDIGSRGYVYCDTRSPYYGMMDCNCDNFDLEANAGSFQCSYEYCFGGVSECCADTCANITLSYTSDGGEGGYSDETCYNFKSPYEQSFCYGHSRNEVDGMSSCFGSFNGASCDSCNFDSVYCTMFDCANTGLGIEEEFCVEDFYPPVLTHCYADCVSCSICPDNPGRAVTNPDLTAGFVDFTCDHLNYLGSTGFWGDAGNETCTNLVDAVKVDCCTPQPEAPEIEAPIMSPTETSEAPEDAPSMSPSEKSEAPEEELSMSPSVGLPTHLISVPLPSASPTSGSLRTIEVEEAPLTPPSEALEAPEEAPSMSPSEKSGIPEEAPSMFPSETIAISEGPSFSPSVGVPAPTVLPANLMSLPLLSESPTPESGATTELPLTTFDSEGKWNIGDQSGKNKSSKSKEGKKRRKRA